MTQVKNNYATCWALVALIRCLYSCNPTVKSGLVVLAADRKSRLIISGWIDAVVCSKHTHEFCEASLKITKSSFHLQIKQRHSIISLVEHIFDTRARVVLHTAAKKLRGVCPITSRLRSSFRFRENWFFAEKKRSSCHKPYANAYLIIF